MRREGGLSTLCLSSRFACQQRVIKTFSGPGYLCFKDGIFWIWHLQKYFYIWFTLSSCYWSIPFTLWFIWEDGGLSTLCYSCGFIYQQRVLKTIPGSGYFLSEYGVAWLIHLLVNLYIWLTISCYDWIPLTLVLIRRDGGLRTLCHRCGFACQQRVLKTFPGLGYLCFKDGVVSLCYSLVKWLTISSCYGCISLKLGLVKTDGGLSTLCHSYEFACQKRVLKTFPGSGYFHCQYGVVWLWHLLINLYLWLSISPCYISIHLTLELIGGMVIWALCLIFAGLLVSSGFSKHLPGPGCLSFKDGVFWLWHLRENLYIWLTISSCYVSMRFTLELIWRNGGLRIFCHSCRFASHQRVLKTFTGPGYFCSVVWLVWLWHLLIKLYVLLTISSCYGPNPFEPRVYIKVWWFKHSVS